jgi:hypothetical protein
VKEERATRPIRAWHELVEQYPARLADPAAEALSDRYSRKISVEQCRSTPWPMPRVMMPLALGAAFERLVATKASPA